MSPAPTSTFRLHAGLALGLAVAVAITAANLAAYAVSHRYRCSDVSAETGSPPQSLAADHPAAQGRVVTLFTGVRS